MGSGQGAGDEQHGQDRGHDKTEANNEISGGHFEGPVGQFGFVYGEVNLNPPRSPEEVAFRARYMARMQEEWDAKDKEAAQGQDWAAAGCFIAVMVFVIAGVLFVVYLGITSPPP